MCINLTQLKLEQLAEKILRNISKEYKKALEKGGMSGDPKEMEKMMKKQGGCMR